jgi:hypothetical protein
MARTTKYIQLPEDADEQWKPLPSYDGKYLISNYGRIRSMYNQGLPVDSLITPKITAAGYYYYILYKRGAKPASKSWGANRLVALSFIPNPDDLPEVGFRDGDKSNLHVSNLYWTEHIDNVRKSQGYYYSYYNVKNPEEVFFARSRRQVSIACGVNVTYFMQKKDINQPTRNGWIVRIHKLSTTDRFKGFDF